MKMLLREKKN